MNKPIRGLEIEPGLTRALANRIAGLQYDALPLDVVSLAKQCVLDWVAVTLHAAQEPLVVMLADQVAGEGGNEVSTLLGRKSRVSPRQAALVNGAASHALDYDDVNLKMSGHPTVAALPAALALAEARGASGRDLIAAFVAGYEAECEIGETVAPSHYARGFHVTGTVGAFGAAAASAHLMRLPSDGVATALGIAGTQAAGLKSMFGTMCKPLHAGKASENGVLAAELAARGFTSRQDVLECTQGFVATHADSAQDVRQFSGDTTHYHIRDNLFKYHASCYQTHAAIEALRALHSKYGFSSSDVEGVVLRHDAGADTVCNIPEPKTGLEIKFSLRMIAAFALAGVDTALVGNFTEENARHPKLIALRDKVEVTFAPNWPVTRSEASVRLTDGRLLHASHDSGVPEADIARQEAKLLVKFRSLVGQFCGPRRAEEIASLVLSLEQQPDLKPLMSLLLAQQM